MSTTGFKKGFSFLSAGEEKKKKPKPKKKEEGMKVEPSSMFQRQRVDVLLDLITRRFPPKISAAAAPPAASAATNGSQGQPTIIIFN